MFRRSAPETTTPAPDAEASVRPGAKGRPTPTRKEAEAAARARAKTPRTRKEQAAAQRRQRAESGQRMREAMKTGDERYLPARDRGPVRRFIRDFVDVRISFIELLIPLMVVVLVLGWTGNQAVVNAANAVLLGSLVMIVLEMVFLRMRVRKELRRRFPEEPLKGTTYYAIMRAMQMRFMRLPKAQVKLGQPLPEHYR